MSIEAMNHVWKHTIYPAAQSYILQAIADVVNDTYGNRFFMSVPDLAKKVKCSDRTVQRSLSQFVEDGWLSVEVEGTGRGKPTEYQFHLVMGVKLSPITEERVTPVTIKGDKPRMQRVTNEVSIHLLELNRTQVTQEDSFNEFWKIYPKHNGGVLNNQKAWAKAIKIAPVEEIISGAIRYRDDPNRNPQYTAYPASWLNKGMWTDSPLTPKAFKDGRRSLVSTPTLIPPRFDPKEFPQTPLDPERVAKIRRENGV